MLYLIFQVFSWRNVGRAFTKDHSPEKFGRSFSILRPQIRARLGVRGGRSAFGVQGLLKTCQSKDLQSRVISK